MDCFERIAIDGWIAPSKRELCDNRLVLRPKPFWRIGSWFAVASIVIIAVQRSACAAPDLLESPSRRPNIVILLADDLGYGELGCQGNREIPTPFIDSIAKEGTRFTDGYVSAPYCSASRAGLMTGRLQTRFGYEFNPIGAQNDDPDAGLPGSERTLARHLHEAGYTTALIGKWHLGGTAKYNPLRRGFDEFFGFLHEGHFYAPPPFQGVTTWLRRKKLPNGGQGRWTSADQTLVYATEMGNDEPAYDANNPIICGGTPIQENCYLTDAWTRQAIDFIGRCKDRPFFLYLAYNAVHSPMQGADAYMQRFENIDDIHRRIFAAMLSNLDDSVGAVLKKIRAEGLDDNTLVFFLSDNGGPTRELTSSNLPLRGQKGDVWEGGIRVPFMVRWPQHIPAGKIYHRPVISLDIYSTAAHVAAAPLPKGRTIDGVNLLPFLQGQQSGRPHDALFWRLHQKTAIRVGDWKLVCNPGRGTDAEWHLYDLANDIREANDRARANPSEFNSLRARWQQFNDEMVDPVWSPSRN